MAGMVPHAPLPPVRACVCLVPRIQLGVLDTKLGGIIKDTMGIPCVYNQSIMNLVRGIRSQVSPACLPSRVCVCVRAFIPQGCCPMGGGCPPPPVPDRP